MRRLLAVMLALTCIVGSTPSFARGGGHGHGFGGGGLRRDPTTLLGAPRAADPHLRESDSGPAPTTRAGTHHQRSGVAARAPVNVSASEENLAVLERATTNADWTIRDRRECYYAVLRHLSSGFTLLGRSLV
jgi:hypothetical protein